MSMNTGIFISLTIWAFTVGTLVASIWFYRKGKRLLDETTYVGRKVLQSINKGHLMDAIESSLDNGPRDDAS